jgi:hypothetical protein
MTATKKLGLRILIMAVFFGVIMTAHIPTNYAAIDLGGPDFQGFNKILFVKHQPYPSTSGFSEQHMCDQYFGFNGVNGGGLYTLNNCFSGSPTVTDILANSYCTNGRYQGLKLTGGTFLSPDLSYDGTQVVFAYTDAARQWDVWNVNTTYHIFKVNLDGTNLTQLTDGNWNDFDPCWLPDGRIVFISERRGGFGRCHQRIVPTYTLHTMNADGSSIRTISYHETNEWGPSVDNNGMILFTRWDYVDRGATHIHSTWITTPDGLDERAVTLNYPNSSGGSPWRSNLPLMQMSIRAIPNSNKLVGTGAPHHGQNYGAIIVIDPDIEDDDNMSTITNITPDNSGFPEVGGGSLGYGTPYPLSETNFLCVHEPSFSTAIESKRFALYVIDKTGQKTLLYRDANFSCLEPIPVRARTVPNAIPGTTPPGGAPPDATVTVANVYDSLLPLPTGTTVTQLRIWQVYPKSTTLATSPRVSYEATESSWAGRGTRGLIGTVPVDADGSASFYLPAGRQYLFQAVASDGTAVQTMRSGMNIVPGQTRLNCQGCHDPRYTAPAVGSTEPTAFRRTPSTITADPATGSRPMSFPRLIQPTLDSKCISCHNGSQVPDLRKGTNDGNGWFASYNNLKPYVFLFDVYYSGSTWDYTYPRTEPGKFGSKMSSLYTKLASGHGSLTSAELHRFVIWMDSGFCPFFGEYNNIAAQQNGDQVEPILN